MQFNMVIHILFVSFFLVLIFHIFPGSSSRGSYIFNSFLTILFYYTLFESLHAGFWLEFRIKFHIGIKISNALYSICNDSNFDECGPWMQIKGIRFQMSMNDRDSELDIRTQMAYVFSSALHRSTCKCGFCEGFKLFCLTFA